MPTLAEARKARGISQGELARYLDVTQAAVSQWERGEYAPSAVMRTMITNMLRTEISWADEYEPLDAEEKAGLVQLTRMLAGKFGDVPTARMLSNATKYDLRVLMKGSGILPVDYIPQNARDTEPLLPLDVQIEKYKKQKQEEKSK